MTNTEAQSSSGLGFLFGVVAGGIVGTALTFYLAPRLRAELRQQMTDSARRLRRHATEQLEHVTTRIGDALEPVSRTAPADATGDSVSRT